MNRHRHDYGQYQRWLADATYQPGVRLQLWDRPTGMPPPGLLNHLEPPMLAVTLATHDSATHRPTEVQHHMPALVLPGCTEDDWHLAVLQALAGIAVHEAMEWYRVRGVPVVWPHDGQRALYSVPARLAPPLPGRP